MALAARGSRNLDEGEESIEDEALRNQLKRQARGVIVKSAVASVIITLATILISV